MVRPLKQAWARLRAHPRGRWVALVLELLWLGGLVAATCMLWDAPQAYFSYMGI